jgi:hypothetical protein
MWTLIATLRNQPSFRATREYPPIWRQTQPIGMVGGAVPE